MIPRTFSELHQLVMDASRDPQDSEEALPKRKFLQELTDDQLRACFTELESKSSGDDEVLQDSLTMIQNFFGTARAWVPTVFDRLTKCIPPLWLQTRVPDFPTLLFLITRPNFAEEQSAIFTILGREHLLKLLNQEIVPTEKKNLLLLLMNYLRHERHCGPNGTQRGISQKEVKNYINLVCYWKT